MLDLITKRDFESNKHYRDLIQGYEAKQLIGTGYDFRAAECLNLTTGETVVLSNGKPHRIYRGDFVVITTRESINLNGRDNIWGLVFSKVSFGDRGLSHLGTKIDPGFVGPLSLSFENRGYDIIEISAETSICSVALLKISRTGEAYVSTKSRRTILRQRPNLALPLTKENAEENRQWYSKEILDIYSQLSREVETFKSQLSGEVGTFKKVIQKTLGEVEAKQDRADRIYTGAVLTIFVAAISVTGVLLSASILLLNVLRLQVEGPSLVIPKTTAFAVALGVAGLFLVVLIYFAKLFLDGRIVLGFQKK